MRVLLPRRRVWRGTIYLVSVMLVLLAADLVLIEVRRTIHPGFETTRIVGPVLPDGSIDYLSAIENYFSIGVTPENNAAVLILQALGRSAVARDQPVDGITGRLGMPHLPEAGDYFVSYDDYWKAHSLPDEPDPTDPVKPDPWPATFSPGVRAWLTANERPLAVVSEAVKRTRFFIPFNGGHRHETLIEVLIQHLKGMRELGRPLLTRAMMRLKAGDFDGFRKDVMTVHRLARLLAQASTMVERMAAVHDLEIPTCRMERAAAGGLSAEQARTFAADLRSLGDMAPITDAVNNGERLFCLDTVQAFERAGASHGADLMSAIMPGGYPAMVYRFLPIQYDEVMRVANQWYDGLLAARQQSTYAGRMGALKQLSDDVILRFENRNRVSQLLSPEFMVAGFLPGLTKSEEGTESARMEGRLSQVALALVAYKADRHEYPVSLNDLAPAYMDAVPYDLFTEKPLIYARTATGYTLYSVGPNMSDDGGDRRHGDDVVASIP